MEYAPVLKSAEALEAYKIAQKVVPRTVSKKKKSCMTRRLSTRVAWSKQVVGVPHLDRNGLLRPVLVWASSSLLHHFL